MGQVLEIVQKYALPVMILDVQRMQTRINGNLETLSFMRRIFVKEMNMWTLYLGMSINDRGIIVNTAIAMYMRLTTTGTTREYYAIRPL